MEQGGTWQEVLDPSGREPLPQRDDPECIIPLAARIRIIRFMEVGYISPCVERGMARAGHFSSVGFPERVKR